MRRARASVPLGPAPLLVMRCSPADCSRASLISLCSARPRLLRSPAPAAPSRHAPQRGEDAS
eukprot:2313542-Pyramimonas_sp.AAC.1